MYSYETIRLFLKISGGKDVDPFVLGSPDIEYVMIGEYVVDNQFLMICLFRSTLADALFL